MAWMSINTFKRTYGIGKPYGEEKEHVIYEKFHSVKAGDAEMIFECKKRYVKLFTEPMDSVVPISVRQAQRAIFAIEKRVEVRVPGKWHYHKKAIKKDSLGQKIYGQFNDAQDIAVVVREIDSEHAVILWVAAGLPHLGDVGTRELVLCLSRFVHEKKRGGKACKDCSKLD